MTQLCLPYVFRAMFHVKHNDGNRHFAMFHVKHRKNIIFEQTIYKISLTFAAIVDII